MIPETSTNHEDKMLHSFQPSPSQRLRASVLNCTAAFPMRKRAGHKADGEAHVEYTQYNRTADGEIDADGRRQWFSKTAMSLRYVPETGTKCPTGAGI